MAMCIVKHFIFSNDPDAIWCIAG